VESLRTEEGPRQRVVAHLGELNHSQQRRWQRTVVFYNRHGDVEQLRLLKLDEIVERHLPAGRHTVRPADVVAVEVINRLCAPSSESALAEHWYASTGLEDLLGIPDREITKDRLYRTLAHYTLAGNTQDVETVRTIVTAIESRFGKSQRVWVMDRGMMSEENLRFLSEPGRHYLIGTRRSELAHFQEQLSAGDWLALREGEEAKPAERDGVAGRRSCGNGRPMRSARRFCRTGRIC